jgi:antitoxin FitA
MPSVQVKDVPAAVHAVLRRRATDSGQSLQEYLWALLADHARNPTVEEILARAADHDGGRLPFPAAGLAVRAARSRR